MYSKELFIKSIKTDDNNRILISIQDTFVASLKEDSTKQEIKKMVIDVLKENFLKLEIGKNTLRITVKENPEKAIEDINLFIEQMLQMAGQFMNKSDSQ